jgi:hypothetical protein
LLAARVDVGEWSRIHLAEQESSQRRFVIGKEE